jgi:hypothetical protein
LERQLVVERRLRAEEANIREAGSDRHNLVGLMTGSDKHRRPGRVSGKGSLSLQRRNIHQLRAEGSQGQRGPDRYSMVLVVPPVELEFCLDRVGGDVAEIEFGMQGRPLRQVQRRVVGSRRSTSISCPLLSTRESMARHTSAHLHKIGPMMANPARLETALLGR